jgi:hypothetical protein
LNIVNNAISLKVGLFFSRLVLLFAIRRKAMAKPLIDEDHQKKMVEQYNAEAAFRSDAYWDGVENDNPIAQGFRYIIKNYEISFEKQERLGRRGEGYRMCFNRRKRPRNDL